MFLTSKNEDKEHASEIVLNKFDFICKNYEFLEKLEKFVDFNFFYSNLFQNRRSNLHLFHRQSLDRSF